MTTAIIAFTACGVGLMAMIAASQNASRLRRAGTNKSDVNKMLALAYIAGLCAVVAQFVGFGALPQPSQRAGSNLAAAVAFVVLHVSLTGFTVIYLALRHRRIRRATEIWGEPLLTRRTSFTVATSPIEALHWVRIALNTVDAFGVVVDKKHYKLSAETHAKWNDAARKIRVEVEPVAADESTVHIASWPQSEFATHDQGMSQYFVDNLAKEVVSIGANPPDPDTPENQARSFLAGVLESQTVDESIKSEARAAIEDLDSGNRNAAASLCGQVIDAIRFSYPVSDPARRLTERDFSEMIDGLSTAVIDEAGSS
jgi:hypothetical protein